MKLIKVKGIVLKEITYGDNDKIITILTDELGKITAIAKGAKKNSSKFLASCQYLVYSEFVLYKGSKMYHVNSCETISLFYKLRTDFDKLNEMFYLTKHIINLTDEDTNLSNLLSLFLNTLYIISENIRDDKFIVSVFKIKMLSILGYSMQYMKCNKCKKDLVCNKTKLFYDYVSNNFYCNDCDIKKDRNISISYNSYMALRYIIFSDIKKCLMITIEDKYINEFNIFANSFLDCVTNSI